MKFVIDNESAVVPVSCIKHFDGKDDFIPGERQEVFWSPVSGQIPRDLKEENGYIPSVDKLKEKHQIRYDDRDPISRLAQSWMIKKCSLFGLNLRY